MSSAILFHGGSFFLTRFFLIQTEPSETLRSHPETQRAARAHTWLEEQHLSI